MSSQPSLLAVLLGLPSFVFLVAVCTVTVEHVRLLRRFAHWLVYTAGGW